MVDQRYISTKYSNKRELLLQNLKVHSKTILGKWKPFKNHEKCFLFHVENYFCFLDIQIFVLTFWPCRKTTWSRKISLFSKFMKSQPELQTVLIDTLRHIWRGKHNQTMKFDQLIEYSMIINFLEKTYTKCGGETSPRNFSKKSNLSISLDQ